MRIIVAVFITLFVASFAFGQNLVLMNGSVIDGTGKVRVVANVRVREGKISDIGPFKPMPGEMLVDVKGMIVAPGVVDFRSLSPSESLLAQGVTTVILGSDGSGPYSIEDFMLPFDEKAPALNIAMLVGHGTIRRQILGPDYKRAATAHELELMSELISDAMKQGAFGLASDLRSEPASFSSPEELLTLGKTMSRFGGTLAINLRTDDAVKDAIAIARDAKIPVQVFTSNKAAIAEIDKARVQKIDITADSYTFDQLTRDKATTLERAIQRLAATPASRFGLRERGLLKKGAPADIVVFSPQALSAGMKYVLVNGVVAFKDGQPTDARSGQALR